MSDAGANVAPSRAEPKAAPLRRLTLLVFLALGAAYALFAQDNVSHNTLCRAALAANLVQHGRVDIEGFEGLTTDLAVRDGVYYCDKAPGMSLMAAPTAFAFTRVAPITPQTPYDRTWSAFLYICSLATSALLTAAAGVAAFRYVLARTNDLHGALVAAAAFGLASPVWGWATSFFSHAATAGLLVLGFVALDAAVRRLATGGRAAVFGLLGGLALGAATAAEYTSIAPAAVMGAGFALASPWSRPLEVVRMFAAAAVGGLVALAPVLVYHAAAFGSPFTTGYGFAAVYEGTHGGLFGIGAPRLDILLRLIVSGDRGVIWYAPIVLAMGWAAGRLTRHSEQRTVAVVMILIAAWFLLMNAGFAYWHGGASTGPRYLTPAVGFGALALGLCWPLFGVWERRATTALLGLSIAINFACTAVGMTAGSLFTEILPAFVTGDLRQTLTFQLYETPSPVHYLPPLAAAAVFAWLIRAEMRRLKAA